MALEVDTIIEIYDIDGITQLTANDNIGEGLDSKLTWRALTSGTHFIRVSQKADNAFGCSASYDIRVKGEPPIFLPLKISRTQNGENHS